MKNQAILDEYKQYLTNRKNEPPYIPEDLEALAQILIAQEGKSGIPHISPAYNQQGEILEDFALVHLSDLGYEIEDTAQEGEYQKALWYQDIWQILNDAGVNPAEPVTRQILKILTAQDGEPVCEGGSGGGAWKPNTAQEEGE